MSFQSFCLLLSLFLGYVLLTVHCISGDTRTCTSACVSAMDFIDSSLKKPS